MGSRFINNIYKQSPTLKAMKITDFGNSFPSQWPIPSKMQFSQGRKLEHRNEE